MPEREPVAHDELERIARLTDELAERSTELTEVGAREDVPAIEYNARQIRETVRILEQNVPRELLED